MSIAEKVNAQYEQRKQITDELSKISEELDTYLQTNAGLTISELYKLINVRSDITYAIETISAKEMQCKTGKEIIDKIGSMIFNMEVQEMILNAGTGANAIGILNNALQENWNKGYSLVHQDYDVNKAYRRIKKLRTESNAIKTNMNSTYGRNGV